MTVLTGNPLRGEIERGDIDEVEITIYRADGTKTTQWFRPGPTKEAIQVSQQTTNTGAAFYIQYYGERARQVFDD